MTKRRLYKTLEWEKWQTYFSAAWSKLKIRFAHERHFLVKAPNINRSVRCEITCLPSVQLEYVFNYLHYCLSASSCSCVYVFGYMSMFYFILTVIIKEGHVKSIPQLRFSERRSPGQLLSKG